jgi:outer membrane protein assembly factor BamD
LRLAAGLFGLALLLGCASGSVDLEKLSSPSDEVVWTAAQEALEKKDYQNARQYLRRIIDAFPQSRYQADSRIALADSYLAQGGPGNSIMAVSAYREFLTLYPSAPQAAYAQFQAAEAYFKERNKPDRDQTSTLQALDEYQRLLDVYPDSQYVEQARERIQECRQTLAEASFNVGYFYQKTRKAWRAAIGRYQSVLRKYPDYAHLDEVIFRLGEAYAATAQYNEARPTFARLQEEYPESRWISKAQEILAEMPEMLAPMAPTTAQAEAPAEAAPGPAEGEAATADAGPVPAEGESPSSEAEVRPPQP